ncbi:GlxA family transcriptional regulator [Pseudonocardia sp. N23]|uniref:GlxA family transcriptional regulator n=1 Tax=Pseudonocardia sp. N23 TaxID=1987376 RepID=UPI000BFCE3B3|nr:helix-turn-helix domain-containing protein [Pseudonocardia sp. N23]GAY12907.1 transcriptional regulator containing an amidase domain and an AraC-type DNA-binding HTH domain [Pseudonocardia sp. N23]
MHSIVVLALPSVVTFDLSVPFEVFNLVEDPARYELSLCGVMPGRVQTNLGFEIEVAAGLEALLEADTVIVPGLISFEEPPGEVGVALRAAWSRGARVVSLCTGAFTLGAAGLLDGRRATTHWLHAAELARRYPDVEVDADVLYTEDRGVWTSAGIAAGIDLCIDLVRTDGGMEEAAHVARRMVVPLHRGGGQAQFIERPVAMSSDGLSATCEWALQHLDERLTIQRLAEHASWAPRTFARRFVAETGMSPMRWLIVQRVRAAMRLLEQTDLSVAKVARDCGLGTAVNLRAHFAREVGTTPTAYRRNFRGQAQVAAVVRVRCSNASE